MVDLIELQAANHSSEIMPLVKMLCVVAVIEVVAIGCQVIVSNRIQIHMTYVRFRVITEKNDKLLSMNYQTLEQPHILDMHQRAANSLGGDFQGFQGMMNRVYNLSVQVVTLIVTASTILVLDPRLILVLTLAMVINYLSQQWSIRDDKKNLWATNVPPPKPVPAEEE